eukprot:jgi/Botrbrau1/710/Bobra.160_2s0033.1
MTSVTFTHKRVVLVVYVASIAFISADERHDKGTTPLITSVKDLESKMYTVRQDTKGCVELLFQDGTVGCHSEEVSAPLRLWSDMNDSTGSPGGQYMVYVPAAEAYTSIQQIHDESGLRERVAGVLVGMDRPAADSPDRKFPQAPYMPYRDSGYVWNRNGTHVLDLKLDFPVLLLDNVTGPEAIARASSNKASAYNGRLHYATVDSSMQAKASSPRCIQDQSCQPLGGHSVWAALPPFLQGTEGPPADLPITLVLASIDSNGLFHTELKGADNPMSGLISMLAAAEILGNSSDAKFFRRRLVFVALAGEPWGYMGSKRLLWELQQGLPSTQGLSLSLIDQVVEIGQVGRAVGNESIQFYIHSQQGPQFGVPDVLTAAFAAAAKEDEQVQITEAAKTLPGIPPSSLSSFLRANASIAGIVIAEFNEAFINPFYNSHLDTQVNPLTIKAAAAAVARALHAMAINGTTLPPLKVDENEVAATVEELVACLVKEQPGLGCGLARSLTTVLAPSASSHYIGILFSLTEDSQEPDQAIKSDVARFLWNFLALRTAAGPGKLAGGSHKSQVGMSGSHEAVTKKAHDGCDPYRKKCQEGSMCVGWRTDAPHGPTNGQCLVTTARFVPSYSTSLICKECKGQGSFGEYRWELSNQTEEWEKALGWPRDPIWTESTWAEGVPSLRMFLREPAGAARRVFSAGLAVTLASAIAIFGGHIFLTGKIRV